MYVYIQSSREGAHSTNQLDLKTVIPPTQHTSRRAGAEALPLVLAEGLCGARLGGRLRAWPLPTHGDEMLHHVRGVRQSANQVRAATAE